MSNERRTTPEFRIGHNMVGTQWPVFVIAEIGVNHDGSAQRAIELVHHAKAAGADAVKLQIFSAANLVSHGAPTAAYQQQACGQSDQASLLASLQLSDDAIANVVDAIQSCGMVPLATPFSVEDVALIQKLNLPAIKIASPDLVNLPLLRRAAKLGRPMLVSTGASTLDEVDQCVDWLRALNVKFAMMHCVSSYPVSLAHAHLAWIADLARRGRCVGGYSDHTTELAAGALAVAGGAAIVEKHLTYDTRAAGPDHSASFDPQQFGEYVKAIRVAEAMRGTGVRRLLDDEQDVRTLSRQSLVAARDLPAGTRISDGDLRVQRPGTGISAEHFDMVLGKPLMRAAKRGEVLTHAHVKLTQERSAA